MATQTPKPAAAAPAAAPEPKFTFPKGDNPMADRQIRSAVRLEHERGELLKKVNANRELLRLMADTDELSEAQEEWIDVFYGTKENGVVKSAEESEASRKLREAARKNKIA